MIITAAPPCSSTTATALYVLLERAKTGDSAQALKAYLDAGGSPTAVPEVRVRGGGSVLRKLPLLHYLAYNSPHPHHPLPECVRLLIAAGVDINAMFTVPEGFDVTALMCAIECKCCTAVLDVLLQAGADPCLHGAPDRKTALHIAARLLLARAGTLLEARDSMLRTALMHASMSGRLDIVQLLLRHGAVVNTIDTDKQTPLHVASLYNHMSIAVCLLEAGADVHAVELQLVTPIAAAVQANSLPLVQLLLDHGADINAEN
eukprot:2400-Heterococcus_DN1.PRE.7